jgi:hypothetical protein
MGLSWELTLYLRIYILWSMGNPVTELTLTLLQIWVYSKNLGSGLIIPIKNTKTTFLFLSVSSALDVRSSLAQEQQDRVLPAGGEGAAGGQGQGHQGVAGGAEQGAHQAAGGGGALGGGQASS